MTKTELAEIVDTVYALWNQEPPTNNKTTYEAWWTMLKDLPAETTKQALTQLATLDGYMPRPGTLRRHTITLTGTTPPPTPIEAWNHLQQLNEATNNGTYQPATIHPALQATIQKTGTRLHTNGDREQFIKTYTKETEQWEITTYTPPT